MSSFVFEPSFTEAVFTTSRHVVSRLTASSVAWAFFAGVAAAAYGVRRPIQDIDIIFSAHSNEVVRQLFQDFRVTEKSETNLALALHNIELISGDLTYHSNGASFKFVFDNEMTLRRQRVFWGELPYYFLSREDTIVLKAILRRRIAGTEFDSEDVITIGQAADLDWPYIKLRAERCGAIERIAPALEAIRKRRG